MASKFACGDMETRQLQRQTWAMRKARPNPKPTTRRPTFIRAWRKHRELTQEQLIGRLEALGVELSTGQLSRIESGKQEYRQDQLEALASALSCEPWHLIWRDPRSPSSIIEQVEPLSQEEQRRVADFITGMKVSGRGTGTGG